MTPEQKVGMTIAIEQREKGDSFAFADLHMDHRECGGGPIKIVFIVEGDNQTIKETRFYCKRCGIHRFLTNEDDKTAIINTAIEGVEFRTGSHRGDDLIFIQTPMAIQEHEKIQKLENIKTLEKNPTKIWWQFWRRDSD